MADVKEIITKARAQGIPDQATFQYLQKKGYIPADGKKPDAFNPFPTKNPVQPVPGTSLLPTIGAIGGGILGGIAGGAAGAAVGGIGALPGAAGGATAGAGLGAEAGTALQEKMNKQPLNPNEIRNQGLNYAALEAVGGPVAAGVKAVGAGVGKMFIPKSVEESAAIQTYKAGSTFLGRMGQMLGLGTAPGAPVTSASTAFNKGMVGTEGMIGVQAQKLQKTLWDKTISPALKQVKEKVDMPSFFDKVEAKIIEKHPELSAQKSFLDGLTALKEDYAGTKQVTAEQLQKFKEGWASRVPEKYFRGMDISGVIANVKATAAEVAREDIYQLVGDNAKQAYLDYSNLFGLKQLGINAGAGGPIKAGGTFTGLKNLTEMLTVPAGTLAGQTIYKVGDGIQFIGQPGMRTLRDLLSAPFLAPSSPNTTGQTPAPVSPPPTGVPGGQTAPSQYSPAPTTGTPPPTTPPVLPI